jgi:MATE family multidrug resistance protein
MTCRSEQSPLLKPDNSNESHLTSNSERRQQQHDQQDASELRILLTSALPLILTSLLQFFQIGVALMFIGRIGKDELAAVSLACLTANVTGWSVFQGLASALDTLCPQAYGAGLHKLVGLHAQRMAVLLLLTAFPIAILWCASLLFPPTRPGFLIFATFCLLRMLLIAF